MGGGREEIGWGNESDLLGDCGGQGDGEKEEKFVHGFPVISRTRVEGKGAGSDSPFLGSNGNTKIRLRIAGGVVSGSFGSGR